MLYDTIGNDYARRRIPDPRIACALLRAIGNKASLVNVGAGTGSYEPDDRKVVAIEPSITMIRQRRECAAPAIQAVAERLPLRDKCASAVTAILTIHHWKSVPKGLAELGRIARDRVAILTWDPSGPGFWLTDEYFPTIAMRDRNRFPSLSQIGHSLGSISVWPLAIPRDCIDGFLGAYWCRPAAYLDPHVRAGMSGFVDAPDLESGLSRLRDDLLRGVWHRRFGTQVDAPELDIGYRIVVANPQ